MRYLLDTNALLWSLDETDRLAPSTREVLLDPTSAVLVSIASIWEISIKQSIGKLRHPPVRPWLVDLIARSGFELVPIRVEAALRVNSLPHHHRDPFDRMLIAQALEDGYTIITSDQAFSAYGVPILAA